MERKTLDQRHQMTDLERLRHSAAHVMAAAIAKLWPDAQFAGGPPVEDGFYYDCELEHRISPEDFPAIEAEMKAIVKANQVFEKQVVARDQALADAQRGRLAALGDRNAPSKFKLDAIQNIPEGEPISYFKTGDFVDLCAGPHVMRTGNVGAFKLTSVASAYYKGDEKNPQLQRIYGTAFKNKTEMEAHFAMLEEAKKRDHRKLGAEMGLYVMDTEYVGPGLPLWLPKGTVIVEELEKLAKETEFTAGYVRVKTPHLAKEKMYKTSGHLPYYAESMFPPMQVNRDLGEQEEVAKLDAELQRSLATIETLRCVAEAMKEVSKEEPPSRVTKFLNALGNTLGESIKDVPDVEMLSKKLQDVRVQKEIARTNLLAPYRYYLKAMNCPHHHRIFAAEPRSYRDLPLRLAEYGCCYRYEQSGELFGLMRVRSLNMNDAHIYCTPEQFAAEFNAVNEMYLKYFKIFGLEKYQMRFSTSAPEGMGKKYVDEPALWKQTEDMVRDVLKTSGINYVEVANEAAFYGPKIDVQVWSAIGREFTIATNQVDFAVPAKFELTYRDKDNTEKTPLCIHRAPLGTHERFIGFLIEHYAGNFPLWLAPEQVRVLTIGDEAAVVDFAKGIVNELRAKQVRAEGDFTNDNIKGKIQNAEIAKVHTMLVIGPRDLAAGAVSVRVHGKGNQGVKPRNDAVGDIFQSIAERRS
jgi:threonyl-tRNA synthetase